MATLLTGVGYIGAALLGQLAERGAAGDADAEPIVALENFYCTSRAQVEAALPPGTRLTEGDVAEPADVARAFAALAELAPGRPTTVFHLAAQPSAAIATRDPEITQRSNLKGARIVLEAAHAHGARVVFGGSFRVYGDELVGQTVDERTPYGRVGDLSHLSKVYVEQLARMLGLPFVSVRLGVTYGLSPIMKTQPAFMTVPNLFCQRAVRGEILRVLEDRPLAFIHVEDAAAALLHAAGQATAGPTWQVVNAAPEVATIGQVAHTVQRLARARGGCVAVASSAESAASAASPSGPAEFRVVSALERDGFRPRHTLAESLGEVLDLFQSHLEPAA